MPGPILWGPNSLANNLQNGTILPNGQLMSYQGDKNYIGNSSLANGLTTGYSLGNVALTSNFPSGVPTFGSGASGNLSISATSTNPLSGLFSLSYASSAATTAGNFVATDAFTIDISDQAKALQFKFAYSAVSNPTNGNFSGTSSNSFGVAIYDVTNAAWIQPAGVFNLVQNSGVGIASGTFQTSVNGTSYRFVIYNANASADAITMYFDDFFVGPQILIAGAAVSDWTSTTLTWVGITTSAQASYYRRVGDTIQVRSTVTLNAAATSTIRVGVVPGTSIDTTKASYTANVSSLGYATGGNTPTQNYVGIVQASATANSLRIVGPNGINEWSASVPLTWASGYTISVEFTYPAAGLSSNTVLSNDTDTRVVAMSASYTGAQTLSTAAATPTLLAGYGSVTDTHGAFNSTTGVYTVRVSGWYSASFTGVVNSSSVIGTLYIKKNTTTVVAEGSSSTQAGAINSATVTGIQYYNAGDTIGFYVNAASGSVQMAITTSFPTTVCVHRLSGPATIAASESVNAAYNSTTSTLSASVTPVVYTVRDFDSHNAYNTTTGVYTIPVSGKYRITGSGLQVGTVASSASFQLNIEVDTVAKFVHWVRVTSAITNNFPVLVTGTTNLLAGQQVRITSQIGGATSTSFGASSVVNYFNIERVGN